jgi:hypothetical protein
MYTVQTVAPVSCRHFHEKNKLISELLETCIFSVLDVMIGLGVGSRARIGIYYIQT